MWKRWIKIVVVSVILGLAVSYGVVKCQDACDTFYQRMDRFQQQLTVIIRQQLEYQKHNRAVHYRMIKVQERLITLIGQQQEAIEQNVGVSLPALIERVLPSVVYVSEPGRWSGSGVIVGPSMVLTARHVARYAENLEIETVDGTVYKAISWIEDKENDCALIFFDPRTVFTDIAEFADSDKLQIGESVFSMGSPFGKQLFNTATFGIISGLNREISYFGTCGLITIDAATNPGNSGGPIFNMQGKVIGIAVGSKYGADGLGVVIPSNVCKDLLEKKNQDNIEVEGNKELNFPHSSKMKDPMEHIMGRMKKACGKCHD